MKQFFYLLLFPVMLWSCQQRTGSGNIITQNRSSGQFSSIKSSSGIEVEVSHGAPSIRVQADDNVIDDVETKVEDGWLRIRIRQGVSINNADIKVLVTAPVIHQADVSSGSNITFNGEWKVEDECQLEASSSGEIRMTVDAPRVSGTSSSGGNLQVTGRTRSVVFEASSGSEIEASGLLSENVQATVSSGANIKVHCSVALEGHASSGGSIRYAGNGSVSSDESSGGSIRKL